MVLGKSMGGGRYGREEKWYIFGRGYKGKNGERDREG